MSAAARGVAPLDFASPARYTGDAGRASVVQPTLVPRIPPQFWWGNAGSQLMPGAPRAAAPAASPAPPPSSSSGGCCGS